VYENGKAIGKASLTEINVGPQIGGQAFYEVIFFQSTEALANFKQANFEMSAELSAVAAARRRHAEHELQEWRYGLHLAQKRADGPSHRWRPKVQIHFSRLNGKLTPRHQQNLNENGLGLWTPQQLTTRLLTAASDSPVGEKLSFSNDR